MATLKEIAQAAGVSMATVSNVMNGNYRKVSAETVERVQTVVQQMGYVPNQAARSLAQRESRMVAIISQASPGENILVNPYNAHFIGALTVDLHAKGYYPLIRFTNNFRDIDQDLRGWNVAGAIFNGSFSKYLRQIKTLPPIPIVFSDCYCRVPGINHVAVDDDMGGLLAGEYLGKMGHTRVAFLGNVLHESEVDQHRLAGFRSGLDTYGVTLEDAWVYPSTESISENEEAFRERMHGPDAPTAFFVTSDVNAMLLCQTLNRIGLSVPDDVSVIGFDDLPFSNAYLPFLTTIHQDIDRKAQLIVDMLEGHIKDKAMPPERTVIGVSLIERQSVKNLAASDPAR